MSAQSGSSMNELSERLDHLLGIRSSDSPGCLVRPSVGRSVGRSESVSKSIHPVAAKMKIVQESVCSVELQ